MKPLIVTAIALSLSGCALEPREAEPRAAEVLWQGANAYDWAQTINTARRPDCYLEIVPVTRTMFGQHPSSGEVGVGWALQASLHYLISGWLDREVEDTDKDSWRAIRGIWQVLSFANTAKNIADNKRIGLRPFGKEDVCQ